MTATSPPSRAVRTVSPRPGDEARALAGRTMRSLVEERVDLALPPNVVAGRQHVDAGVEKTAGDTFDVMPAPLAAFSPLAITKSTASSPTRPGRAVTTAVTAGPTEHVAEKQDLHALVGPPFAPPAAGRRDGCGRPARLYRSAATCDAWRASGETKWRPPRPGGGAAVVGLSRPPGPQRGLGSTRHRVRVQAEDTTPSVDRATAQPSRPPPARARRRYPRARGSTCTRRPAGSRRPRRRS